MLGTAASSSTAIPTGRLSQGGAICVINNAIPKLTGTAISMAIAEVTSVPTIGISAPNRSVTGFHSLLARKPRPKRWKAGHAPTARIVRIAVTRASTDAAKTRVAPRNVQSRRTDLRC